MPKSVIDATRYAVVDGGTMYVSMTRPYAAAVGQSYANPGDVDTVMDVVREGDVVPMPDGVIVNVGVFEVVVVIVVVVVRVGVRDVVVVTVRVTDRVFVMVRDGEPGEECDAVIVAVPDLVGVRDGVVGAVGDTDADRVPLVVHVADVDDEEVTEIVGDTDGVSALGDVDTLGVVLVDGVSVDVVLGVGVAEMVGVVLGGGTTTTTNRDGGFSPRIVLAASAYASNGFATTAAVCVSPERGRMASGMRASTGLLPSATMHVAVRHGPPSDRTAHVSTNRHCDATVA